MNAKPASTIIEDNALQATVGLLLDAIDSVGIILEDREIEPTKAILVAVYVIVAKMDAMETQYIKAMCDLREILGYSGACSEGSGRMPMPTAHDSKVMSGTPGEDYPNHHQTVGIEEIVANLRRFSRNA